MVRPMPSSTLARYLNPWKHKREQEQLRRIQALRGRDGDECRRCRRPLRFDLPEGHDLGPRIEQVIAANGDEEALDNLCLTHRRCNTEQADLTAQVKERIRRKAEADLLSNSRKRKKKAA
jgi:5-methylcytosine-specific restriction endonuclease McrA